MAQVQVCRSCGQIDVIDGTSRCSNCSAFSVLSRVTQPEAEAFIRRRKIQFLRNRLVFPVLPIVIIIGLVAWWMFEMFNLGFDPPVPGTTLSASVTPQTWAQIRRDPQNTGFTPDQAPVPSRVRWTFQGSEKSMTAPVVAGNHVYFASEEGKAIALDRETGRLVWEYQSGGPAGSAPAVVGETVIFGFRSGKVVALDQRTGAVVWEMSTRSPIYAAPVVVDGTVFIGSGDSKLHALDASTGEQLWEFSTDDWVTAPVAFSEGTVVVVSQGSMIHILDAKTGRQRLFYDTGANRFGTGPVIHEDIVLLTSDGGRLWAIDRAAQSYPFERAFWKVKINLYVWQMISERPRQKGSVWLKRVGGNITRSPAVAHDTVYVGNFGGEVFALDVNNGDPKWNVFLKSEITVSPIVAGDTVIMGTDKGVVFGLDAFSGDTKWEFDVGEKIRHSPVVAGDTMFVVSGKGLLHAITGPG